VFSSPFYLLWVFVYFFIRDALSFFCFL
jgi:hypothetical protein